MPGPASPRSLRCRVAGLVLSLGTLLAPLQDLRAGESTGFDLPRRPYHVDRAGLKFSPLPGARAATGMTRHGSGYRLEIPAQWNGDLVIWIRGGAQYPLDALCNPQTHAHCTLPDPGFPPIRQHLIDRGFAWASPTFRDHRITPKVRALDAIDTADAIRTVHPGEVRRVFLLGYSLGGLTVQHALELYPADFAGGVAGCSGDSNGYIDFYHFSLAAMALQASDNPAVAGYLRRMTFPVDMARLEQLGPLVRAGLGPDFPERRNERGEAVRTMIRDLSGGERPMFDEGFRLAAADAIPGYIVRMVGVDSGSRSFIDNERVVYRWQSGPEQPPTRAEAWLNRTIPRFRCDPEVCTDRPPARDQTRHLGGVHRLTGELTRPMISLHALGDMIAFFSGAQRYADTVERAGASRFLVQRAVRDATHCGFNQAELSEAFDDLVAWAGGGAKPAGDDTRTPAAVADPAYGCRFTRGAHEGDKAYSEACR